MSMFNQAVHTLLNLIGYDIYRIPRKPEGEGNRRTSRGIPDREFYTPLFSPWKGYGDFLEYYSLAKPHTLVSPDRCYILLALARQARHSAGCWLECGVYRGGTAMLLSKAMHTQKSNTVLHLFDTFKGMPETAVAVDAHQKGDFADTTLEEVRARVLSVPGTDRERVVFHPGLIPETFANSSISSISLAHVDVDIFQSVLDCCEFIFPRLTAGGFLVFDDYGFPSCPGARTAVDQFFCGKQENPIVLPTGQAVVVKAPMTTTEQSVPRRGARGAPPTSSAVTQRGIRPGGRGAASHER